MQKGDSEFVDSIMMDTWGYGRRGWEKFLSHTETMAVEAKRPIFNPGQIDSNIYIVKEGIIRYAYINYEGEETTIAFASKGTVITSPIGYARNLPSFCYYVAVTDCTIVRAPRSELEQCMLEDSEFAISLFHICITQYMAFEVKSQILGGSARAMYDALCQKKDLKRFQELSIGLRDIVNIVSDKIMASYLGVTPSYFSRMKKAILQELRSANRRSTPST